MTNNVNRQFRLKRRPQGRVTRDDFDYVEASIPQIGPDQVLVRHLYLSLDPTNRIWMSDMDQYMPPVELGEVMRGGGIGQVIESNNPRYQVGDLLGGMIGWQDYIVIDSQTSSAFTPMPKGLPVPLPVMMGAMGFTGLTAYFGLLDVGQPQSGETVVISAAAGAVGSVAGQIAKIKGCRVVGIAGSKEKCAWITSELGFDAAVNYKEPDWKDQLKRACPNGVDIDFENVGGEIMNTVMSLLNLKARVVLCGMISGYNAGTAANGSGDFIPILMKRLRVEGFIVLDFAHRFSEATAQLSQWIVEGKLKSRETIVEGLEKAPEALNYLFDGNNIGKLIVKIADARI